MAAPKLTPEQVNRIKEMLASDEPQGRIAKEIDCHIQTIRYYAQKFAGDIEEARRKFNEETINKGFARKEYRIRKLARLLERLETELERDADEPDKMSGLYYKEVKVSSTGAKVEYEVFNAALVREYRAAMDDIAKEVGGRVVKTDITTAGLPVKQFVTISPDDWDKPEQDGSNNSSDKPTI